MCYIKPCDKHYEILTTGVVYSLYMNMAYWRYCQSLACELEKGLYFLKALEQPFHASYFDCIYIMNYVSGHVRHSRKVKYDSTDALITSSLNKADYASC